MAEPDRKPYIFISYSHKDKERVVPVVEAMRTRGYQVWYDEGIPVGKAWTETLSVRIPQCEIFMPFLSRDFENSSNCMDEIRNAKSNQRRMVPVWLPGMKKDSLSNEINFLLSNAQGLTLSPSESPEAFAARLETPENADVFAPCKCASDPEPSAGGKAPARIVTLDRPSQPSGVFVGRVQKMRDIETALHAGAGHVVLWGMGGIGKSEICRKLFQAYTSGAGTDLAGNIGWVMWRGSPKDTVYGQFPAIDETNAEAYWQKAKTYIDAQGKDLLLFVDNADDITAEQAAELGKLPCRLLLTSRRQVGNGFASIDADFLSRDQCLQLYRAAYGEQAGLDDAALRDAAPEGTVDEILRLAAYHTLTVTLLATTQWSAGLSAPELLDELNRTGFDLTGVAEEIRYLHNAGEPGTGDVEENRTFIEHMSRVFDLSKLGERHRFIAWLCNLPFLRRFFWKCTHSTALYALRGMSLLAPNTPTPIQDVEKWLNLPNLNGVNRAAEAGWLVQGTEKGVRCVSIHPVVSAVVRRAYPPEAEIVDALAGRLCEDMCYKETEVFITRLPILKHAVALDRAANPLNLRTGSYGHMLIQMGYLLKKQGNYESALSKYLWGVEIEKDVLGPIHLDVAATYSKIGIVYRILQDYLRAKEYYQNSFLIRKEILGNEHPDTAISYSDIGEVYCGQGDYSHALEYCQKALQLIEKASGPKHRYMAITFNIIGNIYYVQENYSQAFAYYQKAKQIFEEILGQEHPTTAHPYHNIGVLFYQQGNYREALNWLEKAFSIRLNVLGANHPRTKSTQEWLDKTRRALSEEGGTPS